MSTTTEHVYMLWDCRDCGCKGITCSPDARYCPSCGKVRTFLEFDASYLPGDNENWDTQAHTPIPPAVVTRLMNAGANWFCTNCKADNYGDEGECHNCGAPRGASDEVLREVLDDRAFKAYMDGDQGATAALVEQFGEYAGLRASSGLSFDMDDSHEDQLSRAQQNRSAFQSEMQQEQNHQARPQWDTADLPTSVESMERTHGEGAIIKRKSRKKKMVVGAGLASMLLAGGGVSGVAIWGMQESKVLGQVEELSWERQIQEQRWTPVTLRGWASELRERDEVVPKNGSGEQAGVRIGACRMEHHHYEDYVCGTKQVACTHMESYTETYSCTRQESYSETYSCSKSESYSCGQNCSTSRGANGMATRTCTPKTCTRSVSSTCTRTAYRSVPDTCTRTLSRPIHSSDTVDKICQRSIEASRCDYATQHWENSDHYVLSDTKKPAKWPEGSLDALEREDRTERYDMRIVYDSGEEDQEPFRETVTITLDQFDAYNVGDPVTMTITNFGKVSGWEYGDHRDDEPK